MCTPANNNDTDIEVVVQSLTEQDQTNDHQERGKICHKKTDFGFKNALMTPHVSLDQEVVRKVADQFANQNANNWGEVQKPELVVSVTVPSKLFWGCEENCSRDIDSYGPGKADEAVSQNSQQAE